MIPCDHLHRSDVPVEQGLCFIIMPYGEEMDSIYDAGIRPALENLGIRPHRADERLSCTDIMSDIFDDILRAEVIIADLTGKNPNVFYELGLAHAVKRDIILITQARDDVPFDLAGIRYLMYENTMIGSRKLAKDIEGIIQQMRTANTTQPAEFKQARQLLDKAFQVWVSIGDITISLSAFSLIVLYLDDMALDDEHLVFTACCAAYFGRHLARMASRIKNVREGVRALVQTVAQRPMQRPAWRAAAMLEHCCEDYVREEIDIALAGPLLNDERRELLEEVVPQRRTLAYLKMLTESDSVPERVQANADEALRQLTAEFSLGI